MALQRAEGGFKKPKELEGTRRERRELKWARIGRELEGICQNQCEVESLQTVILEFLADVCQSNSFFL